MLDIHDRTTHDKNLRYIKQVLSCNVWLKKCYLPILDNLFIAQKDLDHLKRNMSAVFILWVWIGRNNKKKKSWWE
jgi:hypothetical protein